MRRRQLGGMDRGAGAKARKTGRKDTDDDQEGGATEASSTSGAAPSNAAGGGGDVDAATFGG